MNLKVSISCQVFQQRKWSGFGSNKLWRKRSWEKATKRQWFITSWQLFHICRDNFTAHFLLSKLMYNSKFLFFLISRKIPEEGRLDDVFKLSLLLYAQKDTLVFIAWSPHQNRVDQQTFDGLENGTWTWPQIWEPQLLLEKLSNAISASVTLNNRISLKVQVKDGFCDLFA